MWTFLTSSIFIAGAGSAVIGGLYWSRGTTAAAWTSVICGFVLSFTGIILQQIWGNYDFLIKLLPVDSLPNGLEMSSYITLLCATLYVTVSLLTCKKPHNMDKLLHRGEYAIKDDHTKTEEENKRISWLARKLGFTNEFTLTDKIIYSAQHFWFWGWIIVFAVGTAINFAFNVHETEFTWGTVSWASWIKIPLVPWVLWWKIHLGIFIFIALLVTVWYTIGGAFNMVDLVKTLTTKQIDDSDDGTVVHSKDDYKED